jgi:hypothetical protein
MSLGGFYGQILLRYPPSNDINREIKQIKILLRNWFHPILQHSSKSQVPLHSIHYDQKTLLISRKPNLMKTLSRFTVFC